MKPEFSKPFNLEHAKAGAPIGTVDGDAVEILKWKYRVSDGVNHILGLIVTAQCEIPAAWKFDGTMPHGYANSENRYLVMLPLGLIDGKPVFVGDQLVNANGTATTAFVGIDITSPPRAWRWPAPAKVYPVTTMTDDDLWTAQSQADGGGGTADEFRAIANAALRHAVDAGQVVPKNEHEAALERLGEQLMGISLGDRAARDMAVAEAIRQRCRELVGGSHITNLDVAAIITTIK